MKDNRRTGWHRAKEIQSGHALSKDKDNVIVNKARARAAKEFREKEMELLNTSGPLSTPERHYPKSIFLKDEEE